MCYALYIAVDDPLQTSEWSKETLRAYLEEISIEEKDVKNKFTRKHVYYFGSWQSCGCGWFAEEEPPKNDQEMVDLQRTKDGLAELRTICLNQLKIHEKVELFLCWEGSHAEKPKQELSLTPNDFEKDSLPMEELDFAVVTSIK